MVKYFDSNLDTVYEKEYFNGRLSAVLVHPGVVRRNFVTNADPLLGTDSRYPPVGAKFAFKVISLYVASVGLPTGYAVSLKE